MLFNLNLNVAKEESDILLEVLITITPHIGKSILRNKFLLFLVLTWLTCY